MKRNKYQNFLKSIKTGDHLNLNLESGGRLKTERTLPYLLIYRNPDPKDEMVSTLISGESSYLIISDEEDYNGNIAKHIRHSARIISEKYGAVIIIEIWIGANSSNTFQIKAADTITPATINTLRVGLENFCATNKELFTEVVPTSERYPPSLKPIITLKQCQEIGAYLIGLEIPPFFKNEEAKEFYFMDFRKFKIAFSKIIRKSIFEFIRVQTSFKIQDHNVLGSTKINSAVWEVDKQLFEIQNQFQFLLLISPTNTNEAMQHFIDNSYNGNPKFLYRLLPIDPDRLKEQLFSIKIKKIQDPALTFLFMDKREELEKQITMLKERGSKNFLFSSIRLYNSVDSELYQTAENLLETISPESPFEGKIIDCFDMAEKCRMEIEYYKQFYPDLRATVEVKPDVVGMLVSKGNLYIGKNYQIPENRIEALIHHEIGTHVLTFYNGKVQPFKQLSIGLADYDELQEGLAVLSEYLVGGLTKDRLRLLAARVVAGHFLSLGMNFEDTFHKLTNNCKIDKITAFQVTARIHQGGGCTKDIIYLRGIINLLDYLANGGDLELLYIGKIALKHVPLIQELKARKIIKKPPLYPRYLQTTFAKERLERLKKGIQLSELID